MRDGLNSKVSMHASAARNRRNEYHAVAVGKRLRPLAEFVIDGDFHELVCERERITRLQFRIQLARCGGEGCKRLLTLAGLLAQQGVVLHADLSVSYTHLRAHETGRNLVCRLLLE